MTFIAPREKNKQMKIQITKQNTKILALPLPASADRTTIASALPDSLGRASPG